MDGRLGVDLERQLLGRHTVELGEIGQDLVAFSRLHREDARDELLAPMAVQVAPEGTHDDLALGVLVDLEALHQLLALGDESLGAVVARAQKLEASEIAILDRNVVEVVGQARVDPLLPATLDRSRLAEPGARTLLLGRPARRRLG